ncbi:hypothetical protein VTK73DRAFT_4715 [Phialemonium thermophilum]|uniref:Fe2OG dioxygenase domain-containing protein n=1 Tax=Phialemonium thermophilum TaxID=223376 RepID=A0ABR3WS01_9PEZI
MPKGKKPPSKPIPTHGTKSTTTAATPPGGAASSSSRAAVVPAWPSFRPSLPVRDLAFETLIPSKVVVVRGFWPRSLCRDYVAFLRTLPLQTTPSRPRRGEAVRVNDRFQIDDEAFAARLWRETGLRDLILSDAESKNLWGGEVLGLNPNIRVYRYSKGQYFDCHYDDSNNLNFTIDNTNANGNGGASMSVPVKTTWTLLLYLTSTADGCTGGETVFHLDDRPRRPPKKGDDASDENEIAVPPETGMLLLHKHGDDCLLHEGREVTGGEKWILRTDLCVRR